TSPTGTVETPLRAFLRLPIVPLSSLNAYPPNPEVQRQVALLLAARLKRKAINNADRKNYDAAQACLQEAKDHILDAPSSQLLELDLVAIEALEADLRSRQLRQFRKRGRNEAYQTSTGFDQISGFF
ncbi:MAG: hypothetical protein F6K09_28985, partial [Merismopedia sp. SIO2A8]|nr:hypothetical protein [Merismopedia sp. SIO2A8]